MRPENSPQRLQKHKKILKSTDFHKVYRNQKKLQGSFLILYIAPNNKNITRLGLSVNKKFGGAVERNRFKRALREAFRLNYPKLPTSYDFVIRPRHNALKANMREIEAEFCALLS